MGLRVVWRLIVVVLLVGGFVRAGMAQQPVDLALVLAVDVSRSVDAEEAELQRSGYVAAFRDPAVQAAIRGGAFGRIAVLYLEWAGVEFQRVTVPWTVIHDAESALAFADRIAGADRVSWPWTSISTALTTATELLDHAPVEPMRKVIDISGDGANNQGIPLPLARERALAAGITINGLPVLNDRPNFGRPAESELDAYYEERVIGGPGAFLVVAQDFSAFGQAIRAKLLREIAGVTGPLRLLARR
ncbi:MAG: DUF1194 domain-containing protein [Alphaproteobacteria bacterium]|nr:MAG: DUF1194 domain-containing protein [Alphaproteobacteria bacterium]